MSIPEVERNAIRKKFELYLQNGLVLLDPSGEEVIAVAGLFSPSDLSLLGWRDRGDCSAELQRYVVGVKGGGIIFADPLPHLNGDDRPTHWGLEMAKGLAPRFRTGQFRVK